MRKLTALVALVLLAATLPAGATPVWEMVAFDSVAGGAISYSASGANVVQPGWAFYDKITADGYLGVQTVGGDNIDNPVTGNMAVYAVVNYTDTDNVLAWAMSNPTTPFAIEVRAREFQLDFAPLNGVGNGSSDYSDHYTLDAVDMPGVCYLVTTFAELGAWGYVELAPGVWMDLALDAQLPGAALAVVLEDYQKVGWPDINGYLLPSALGGPIPGTTPGSGIRISADAIPEPLTMLGVFAGVAGLGGYIRKRRNA